VFSGWDQSPHPDRFILGLEKTNRQASADPRACLRGALLTGSASAHDASSYGGVFRFRDLGAAWLTGNAANSGKARIRSLERAKIVKNARAKVVKNARVQVRPEQNAQAQDRSVQMPGHRSRGSYKAPVGSIRPRRK
jgi:hypothetical protein